MSRSTHESIAGCLLSGAIGNALGGICRGLLILSGYLHCLMRFRIILRFRRKSKDGLNPEVYDIFFSPQERSIHG